MAADGLFGDPDSIERLAHALLGWSGRGGATAAVREVRDQVTQTIGGLVPTEWSGDAADAFAGAMHSRDVRDLLALAEAAGDLGAPLVPLAVEIRAANRRGEQAKAIAHAAGFDIDSHGNSDLLHTIEQLVPGAVDAHAMTAARDEMLAARHIAESAWDAARHALASVQVPRIGKDTLRQAEAWGFETASPARGPGVVRTGLPPTERRANQYAEQQRLDGISIVRERCDWIVRIAGLYGVPPVAIAGAILWEAVENPHANVLKALAGPGPGPGKVQWYNRKNPRLPTAAEEAENDGKLPRSAEPLARRQRVVDRDSAIRYIGAILRDSADRYREATRKRGKAIDISADVGVLLTFYEGVDGGPEGAAARDDLSVGPEMGNDMAPWVVGNLPWVNEQLTCLD